MRWLWQSCWPFFEEMCERVCGVSEGQRADFDAERVRAIAGTIGEYPDGEWLFFGLGPPRIETSSRGDGGERPSHEWLGPAFRLGV
ncbi:hypothetical protein MPNT_110030 [Candidatus Methylacidithermus pantelleriae]|uniref:Uncharacterized protein n=1 Tax=Candidatus Methylacidithermus pantelleriae TaxID=2744239 RepID=A0A8J2FNE7_9BACT|nr:hypothetical protein MPNT_110030 [Candidatus Methylacidithermus pantelleriae]